MVDINLLKEIQERLKDTQTEFEDALADLKFDIMKVFHAYSEVEIRTPRFKPFPMVITVERVHDITYDEILNVGSVINKHRLRIKSLKTKETSRDHGVNRYLIYTCVHQSEQHG